MSASPNETSGLKRVMGFWDVMLFNIAAVLGPRWIAAAAHNGTSSITLWLFAALGFFLPTALTIVELSTRYPSEGGLYAWSKEAFGDFHGFVAGWCYWAYTVFYFPGLLTASVAMSVYIGGPKYAYLAKEPSYLIGASLVLLGVAVWLNIVGLDIGKWLQNAGGVATYVPLLILVAIGGLVWMKTGSVTHFTWHNIWPTLDWGTINFWSNIAFAFTGMELVCAMSEEIRDPQRTFPRSIYASGILIALIYILGTAALLGIVSPENTDTRSGVFQAISGGSATLGMAWVGVVAALLVTVGNAGGVGATVAGVARVPFVAGIDHYMPAAFGKLHPKWRTPYVAILVQAVVSGIVLVLSHINESALGAYQILVDAAIIVYFIPFLYMYAAVIKLAYRADRRENPRAVLIPGGKLGVWLAGALGFLVTALSIAVSVIPTAEVEHPWQFELKLLGTTAAAIGIGLFLYVRGARRKRLAATT